MPRYEKFAQCYWTAGTNFLNTFVLFLVLNVGLYGLIMIRELALAGINPISQKYAIA